MIAIFVYIMFLLKKFEHDHFNYQMKKKGEKIYYVYRCIYSPRYVGICC